LGYFPNTNNYLHFIICSRKKIAKIDQINTQSLNPLKLVEYLFLELDHQTNYILKSIHTKLTNCQNLIELNNSLLKSLDYRTVLKRGFALIKSKDGEFITSRIIASNKKEFNIRFFDGDVIAHVKDINN
jgi:exonuclease VII large subunit